MKRAVPVLMFAVFSVLSAFSADYLFDHTFTLPKPFGGTENVTVRLGVISLNYVTTERSGGGTNIWSRAPLKLSLSKKEEAALLRERVDTVGMHCPMNS